MQLCPFQSHPLEAANFSHEPRKRFPSKLSVSRYGALKYFCKEAKWLHSDTSGFFYVLSWNWTTFKKRNAHVMKPTLTARTILDNLGKKNQTNQGSWQLFSGCLLVFLSFLLTLAIKVDRERTCTCVHVRVCVFV